MVAGILGILKAGGEYVPLDSACPDEQAFAFMIRDASLAIIVTGGKLAVRLAACGACLVDPERDGSKSKEPAVPGRHGGCRALWTRLT